MVSRCEDWNKQREKGKGVVGRLVTRGQGMGYFRGLVTNEFIASGKKPLKNFEKNSDLIFLLH